MTDVAEKGFVAGEYTDQRGRVWFCGQQYLDTGSDTISCRSDGLMTAADPATFKRWGWVSSHLRKEGGAS